MARRPGTTQPPLGRLNPREIAAIGKIAASPVTSIEFGKAFAQDPAVALAAKGIEVTPVQAEKIRTQLADLGGSPGDAASVEVGVNVKVKF